jgi:5-oxoprolinase (ATP-hydrolysing)
MPVEERQEPCSGQPLDTVLCSHLLSRAESLAASAQTALLAQSFTEDAISTHAFLNIRYAGTDTAIMTPIDLSSQVDLSSAVEIVSDRFRASYKREYGFELTGRALLVDDVRIRAVGSSTGSLSDNKDDVGGHSSPSYLSLPEPHSTASVYFELVDGTCKRVPTPIYLLKQFDQAAINISGINDSSSGYMVDGPAMIIQDVATVVVEPGCSCFVNLVGNLEITVHSSGTQKVSPTVVDPIYLSIFSHRFMGIAEQMGRTLQRTSISVNIKERLDFSCALFDCHGGLVANAPHLPVHLGAMSEAVRYQVKHWTNPQGDLNIVDGDVLVSNHPQLAGGSHLPDITVITPIFQDGKIVFFVASRGHHSDIGGIAPGSMPPMSKTLVQEGAAIVAFKLVENGEFQEDGISELLLAPGKLENNFGTRNLSDNISDLRAQVAANNRGKKLVNELVLEYSLSVVQAYMLFIQEAAEGAVRRMLRSFSEERGLEELCGSVSATDYLDDGTPISLKISINREEGSAIFDFTGTGPEIFGNLNAPPAVTTSAVIYCLRCLLTDIVDLPLNQGCLTPISIVLPSNSILNPSPTAAVVGGNVLTSQRVTDVIFRAFEAVAASQGCMNNLTFGDATMGYYETIAGGSGENTEIFNSHFNVIQCHSVL